MSVIKNDTMSGRNCVFFFWHKVRECKKKAGKNDTKSVTKITDIVTNDTIFCGFKKNLRVFRVLGGFNEGFLRFLKGVLWWWHVAETSSNFMESSSHLADLVY
jgi:hypothetical protein